MEIAEIKKDKQIWKFCFYGFFKNLKFFEPYLWIYLLGMGFGLFKIGILFSIREIITYVFEIPSGILADQYGKKKELMICFIFYIISFILFFIGDKYLIIAIGMCFFGLGEAFRSGTHKAMILSYLEQKDWFKYKGFVYGRTRSFSLLGSSISAFVSILWLLNIPALKSIFLISTIPYIIDFLLIASYPNSLDERLNSKISIKAFYKESVFQFKNIFHNRMLKKIMASSAIYDGIFKTIKDYIQPILKILIGSASISILSNSLDASSSLKVYLGIIYGVFYIFSSITSRNIYKLTNRFSSIKLFEKSFDYMGILLIILATTVHFEFLIVSIFIYFLIYIMKDGRRPVFVDVCSDYMNKNQRATVLSVESQMKSFFMIILSPLFGLIAEKLGIEVVFFIVGIAMIVVNRGIKIKK